MGQLPFCYNGLDQSRQSWKERPRGPCNLHHLSSRDPPWNPSPSGRPCGRDLRRPCTAVPRARTGHRGHQPWVRRRCFLGLPGCESWMARGETTRTHVHRGPASHCDGARPFRRVPGDPSGAAPLHPGHPCGSRAPADEGLAAPGLAAPSGAARSHLHSSLGGPCAHSSPRPSARSPRNVGRIPEGRPGPCAAVGAGLFHASPCVGADHGHHDSRKSARRGPKGLGHHHPWSRGRLCRDNLALGRLVRGSRHDRGSHHREDPACPGHPADPFLGGTGHPHAGHP